MADWYCDFTNGDDSTGLGTELSPWKTLQKTVDSATGGDTINVANTSAQSITTRISWTSGFTADNDKFTIFKAWDNGGSITIQRPDESAARVAAQINATSDRIVNTTSHPNKLVFENIKFTASAGQTAILLLAGEGSIINGCEFDNTGMGGAGNTLTSSNTHVSNSYFKINSASHSIALNSRTTFIANYIQGISVGATGIQMGATDSCLIENNIFDYKDATASTTHIIINNNQRLNIGIQNNTFIVNSDYGFIGIDNTAINTTTKSINNIFYKFDNASSLPKRYIANGSAGIVGHNAYYSSNAPNVAANIGLDLTANDITASGDPFVDSANNNFTLIESALARQAALANPNSKLDIGAVQSEYGSGGGAVTRGSAWVG
jgi:hypothetical protein